MWTARCLVWQPSSIMLLLTGWAKVTPRLSHSEMRQKTHYPGSQFCFHPSHKLCCSSLLIHMLSLLISINKLLECGLMANVMAALPNIGGALCPMPQIWLMPNTGGLCSNAAKMRNPLKLGGVPQTTGPISAASTPKCTILWGHVEEIMLLNNFFSDCRYTP